MKGGKVALALWTAEFPDPLRFVGVKSPLPDSNLLKTALAEGRFFGLEG